jgi:hypothetical protein
MSDYKKADTGPRLVFGASMPREVVKEIDKVRGEMPRSRWLKMIAIKEIERQKKLKGGPAE